MSYRNDFQIGNKRPTRYTVDEWFDHSRQQYTILQDKGVKAEKVLEQSGRIRKKTKELITKNKYETEWKFKGRIQDIQFVRTELEKVRTLIQEELQVLDMLQERIQDEIKYINVNALGIVQRCIQLREGRTGIDLIHDEVELELEKEEKLIKEADALLKKTLDQTKETKRDLRASLYLLNQDVEKKIKCLAIEVDCLNLKETNMDLRIQPDEQNLDNSTISPDEWARYSNEIKSSSEKKIHDARIFEVHVHNILEEVIVDLKEKYFVVTNAFQRRILDIKEAKTKLETQHYEVARQVNDMTENITELEKAIDEKQGFLALAQTRLERRSNRPGVEFVKDDVEASLLTEIHVIKDSLFQLKQMLLEAEFSLRNLLKVQLKLEEEINIKTNSIKIDEVDCLTLRQSINYNPI